MPGNSEGSIHVSYYYPPPRFYSSLNALVTFPHHSFSPSSPKIFGAYPGWLVVPQAPPPQPEGPGLRLMSQGNLSGLMPSQVSNLPPRRSSLLLPESQCLGTGHRAAQWHSTFHPPAHPESPTAPCLPGGGGGRKGHRKAWLLT